MKMVKGSNMELISSGFIATTVYKMFQQGINFTAAALKDKLVKFIKDDVVAEAISVEVEKLNINEDVSERAIEREINNSQKLEKLINEVNAKNVAVAPATVTNVTQNHSGSGDNVGGNKVTN